MAEVLLAERDYFWLFMELCFEVYKSEDMCLKLVTESGE